MTRKDYELLAEAIRGSLLESVWSAAKVNYTEQHKVIALHVADALEWDNPRFSRDRFLAACGVSIDTQEV